MKESLVFIARACALTVLLFTLGCSSGDAGGGAVDWSKGRGTAACHDWQQAFCELQAECGFGDLGICARQIQAVACAEEIKAKSCAEIIRSSTCDVLTAGSGCTILEMADSELAVQGCNDYVTALCAHNVECGSRDDLATCVTNMLESAACSRAVGIKLNYEDCMKRIDALSCKETLPSSCQSVCYIGS